MFDEFGSEEENWRPRRSIISIVSGKIIKYGFYTLVFGLIALTVVRSILSSVPRDMKTFVYNDSAIAEYNNNDEFIIYQYLSSGSFTRSGLFAISHITYIPSIGQFQATIRYNNRVLNHLKDDLSLDSLPEGEVFVFVLRDNFGNEYRDYSYTKTSKIGYTYRHVIFDGVSLGGDDPSSMVTSIALDIYYIGNAGDGEKVDFLYMYNFDYQRIAYEITPPDKAKKFEIFTRPSY